MLWDCTDTKMSSAVRCVVFVMTHEPETLERFGVFCVLLVSKRNGTILPVMVSVC